MESTEFNSIHFRWYSLYLSVEMHALEERRRAGGSRERGAEWRGCDGMRTTTVGGFPVTLAG